MRKTASALFFGLFCLAVPGAARAGGPMGCQNSDDGGPKLSGLSLVCDFWERTRFELYPEAPDLSEDAAARARRWGRPRVTFACGPRLRWIARIAGWKLARRLQRHRTAP